MPIYTVTLQLPFSVEATSIEAAKEITITQFQEWMEEQDAGEIERSIVAITEEEAE